MGIAIHTIPLGFDNTYNVKDQGTIMIDSGEPKESKAFIIGIKSFNDFMKRGYTDQFGDICN